MNNIELKQDFLDDNENEQIQDLKEQIESLQVCIGVMGKDIQEMKKEIGLLKAFRNEMMC